MLNLPKLGKSTLVANVGRKIKKVVATVIATAALAVTPAFAASVPLDQVASPTIQQTPLLLVQSDFVAGSMGHYSHMSHSSHSSHMSHSSHYSSRW
jgi:hypothetical protein